MVLGFALRLRIALEITTALSFLHNTVRATRFREE
jgi:hypothetical protein